MHVTVTVESDEQTTIVGGTVDERTDLAAMLARCIGDISERWPSPSMFALADAAYTALRQRPAADTKEET